MVVVFCGAVVLLIKGIVIVVVVFIFFVFVGRGRVVIVVMVLEVVVGVVGITPSVCVISGF